MQCFNCLELGHVRATACPPWTEDTSVTGAAKADIVPEAVLPRHPSAPCASHSGLPSTTGWVGWHVHPPPKTKRKRPVHEPAATAKTQGNTAEAAVDGREEGHGIDPMNSRGSSRVTWEGRDGSKSCSSGLSGRARSPSRWWLRRIASLT